MGVQFPRSHCSTKNRQGVHCERNIQKHRAIFAEAIEKLDKKNYALMAALYLLTADHHLWMTTKRYTDKNVIRMSSIKLLNCTEDAYTLCSAAKNIYLGTKHLTISDLSDSNLISPKLFALICNAAVNRTLREGQ